MTDVATVVETAETVAEVAAPVVMATPTLDWKKVAIVGGSVAAVGVGGYICYRLIKKRKAEKEAIIVEEVDPEEEAEEIEE